jgi:twitching motility two-component system response regulator PilH
MEFMSKTILIADDSPTELSLLVKALQQNGYETISAVDGEEALEKARTSHPGLAILDVVMPKKNGFQVTRQLKNEDETRDIKVLLVSSKNQDSDKFWGLKQGADEYLPKPFDRKTLLNAVERLL